MGLVGTRGFEPPAERMKDIRHSLSPSLSSVKSVLFKDHAAKVLTDHYSKKRSYDWAKPEPERLEGLRQGGGRIL